MSSSSIITSNQHYHLSEHCCPPSNMVLFADNPNGGGWDWFLTWNGQTEQEFAIVISPHPEANNLNDVDKHNLLATLDHPQVVFWSGAPKNTVGWLVRGAPYMLRVTDWIQAWEVNGAGIWRMYATCSKNSLSLQAIEIQVSLDRTSIQRTFTQNQICNGVTPRQSWNFNSAFIMPDFQPPTVSYLWVDELEDINLNWAYYNDSEQEEPTATMMGVGHVNPSGLATIQSTNQTHHVWQDQDKARWRWSDRSLESSDDWQLTWSWGHPVSIREQFWSPANNNEPSPQSGRSFKRDITSDELRIWWEIGLKKVEAKDWELAEVDSFNAFNSTNLLNLYEEPEEERLILDCPPRIEECDCCPPSQITARIDCNKLIVNWSAVDTAWAYRFQLKPKAGTDIDEIINYYQRRQFRNRDFKNIISFRKSEEYLLWIFVVSPELTSLTIPGADWWQELNLQSLCDTDLLSGQGLCLAIDRVMDQNLTFSGPTCPPYEVEALPGPCNLDSNCCPPEKVDLSLTDEYWRLSWQPGEVNGYLLDFYLIPGSDEINWLNTILTWYHDLPTNVTPDIHWYYNPSSPNTVTNGPTFQWLIQRSEWVDWRLPKGLNKDVAWLEVKSVCGNNPGNNWSGLQPIILNPVNCIIPTTIWSQPYTQNTLNTINLPSASKPVITKQQTIIGNGHYEVNLAGWGNTQVNFAWYSQYDGRLVGTSSSVSLPAGDYEVQVWTQPGQAVWWWQRLIINLI